MNTKIKIVGILGSLRAESINKKLLDAFEALLPNSVEFELADIASLPLFNQDLESDYPAEATSFKAKIKGADGILIATPEHNRSIPAALKNAVDWASRPYGDNAFAHKPTLVIGATGGLVGTALAQYHLKQILLYLDAHVLGQPEIYIGNFNQRFDKDGKIIDPKTTEILEKAIERFIQFINEPKQIK